MRTRLEGWDWFGSERQDQYAFGGVLARIGATHERGNNALSLEFAAPILIGLPTDAIASAPRGQLGLGAAYFAANDSAENTASVFLKQAYLRLGKKTHVFKLGRIEFIEGLETISPKATLATLERERIGHRLIGNFGFTHVQRSFDGAHYTFSGKSLQLTATALRPTQGVFKVNGWPSLDVGTAYLALNRAVDSTATTDWRGFMMLYRDYRDPSVLKSDNRPAAVRLSDTDDVSIATLGGHVIAARKLGSVPIDLLGWAALQRGSWGAQDHAAFAFVAEGGVQLPLAGQPWIRAGVTASTGDDNGLDDRHETFFQMLPTPRAYARLPFYNMMNSVDRYLTLSVKPSQRSSARAEFHQINLAEGADLWYSGGGAFDDASFGFAGRPSGNDTAVATLFDVSAQYRFSQKLSVNGYLSWATGDDVVRNIYPESSSGRLGYLELEWRW